MRFGYCLVAAATLGACGPASGHFGGAKPVRLEVGKSVFDVRQRGTLVEAVRRNSRYAPRLGQIEDEAKAAVEQATGCRVARLLGDAAVIIARVDCRGDS